MAGPSYLVTVDTLGKLRAIGGRISLRCLNQACYKHIVLDLDELIEELGEDHGCMDFDLRALFFCPDCRKAGRNDHNVSLVHHTRQRSIPWQA